MLASVSATLQGHKKYSVEALHLQFQVSAVLSPQLASDVLT